MSSSSFYVQSPPNAYWCVPLSNFVIKASAIDPQDDTLSAEEKTNKFVRKFLKVEEPADYTPRIIKKSDWVKCEGPSKYLNTFEDYVSFYHYSVDAQHALPVGWEIINGEVKRKKS